MPAPKKWVDKGFLPTHSRILFMFEQLEGKYFTCGMDNLFISAKFCRAAYAELPQKVMIHGACRTHDRRLPHFVIQKDVTTKQAKQVARGTVKAGILQKDKKVSNSVAFSVYDTKPVHFMSTTAKSLRWITKKKGFSIQRTTNRKP